VIAMRLPSLLLLVFLAVGCRSERSGARAVATDSGFAGVQARGQVAMGVNQYTSTHVFTPLPDGGRIELQRNETDSAGVEQIRRHMAMIACRFLAGDFHLPGFVHDREVPGTSVMNARRSAITYTIESLPRGAALRLTTTDSSAVVAIHDFLAFQRQDHHAGAGHDS
jgi:hypothetical protein